MQYREGKLIIFPEIKNHTNNDFYKKYEIEMITIKAHFPKPHQQIKLVLQT